MRIAKKLLMVLLAGIFALGLVGCGGSNVPAGFKRIQFTAVVDEYTSAYFTELYQTYNATQGKEDEVRESLLLAYMNLQRAVKKDGFKLILYNVDGEHYPQLFDLENDPAETHNLYGNPDYADIQEDLTAELSRLMKEAGDFCDLSRPDWGFPGKLTGEQVKSIQP